MFIEPKEKLKFASMCVLQYGTMYTGVCACVCVCSGVLKSLLLVPLFAEVSWGALKFDFLKPDLQSLVSGYIQKPKWGFVFRHSQCLDKTNRRHHYFEITFWKTSEKVGC